jgi:hypothetical protein
MEDSQELVNTQEVADTIFDSIECPPPLREDIVREVENFAALGLSEQHIVKAVTAMFTQRYDDVQSGIAPEVHPEELHAIAIPREYQRIDR